MAQNETYAGGYKALIERAQTRRDPLIYGEGESLTPLETDLAPLRAQSTVVQPNKSGSSFGQKRLSLQQEFAGQPELLALHGLVIANLRKSEFPDHAPALFQKIWAEHGDFLLEKLPLRWLVSAITTFGDQGVNEAQRSIGRSLTLMFGMIKLYEFERLYSGHYPSQAFTLDNKVNTQLPLGIPSYSLVGGGLDVALLTRLWVDAQDDPVVRPLACHLLNAINSDPDTLFRRLNEMGDERRQRLKQANTNPILVPPRHVKRDPKDISWAVATTLNEDMDKAVHFAAHHLDLGADLVVLYADNPADAPLELAAHPKIKLVICDETQITAEQRENMNTRAMRKAYYFNKARRTGDVDWIAMLDVDEFLHPERDISEILAQVPADAAFLHVTPVEQLAGAPNLFRLPLSNFEMDARQKADLFPVFGDYVTDMVLGKSDPRIFVRARLKNIRVTNFAVRFNRKMATNSYTPPDLVVAHCHADSFESFKSSLPRRIEEGYAYAKTGEQTIKNTLEAFDYKENATDLEAFFHEVCSVRPELLEALEAHEALFEIDLNLDEKVNHLIEGLVP